MFKKEDVQMISVCAPNYLHKEIVVAAANAGKHIVCEKPLATTIEDANEMIESSNQNKVKLMYAEDWIFAPALVRARGIYKEGAIGDIIYVKAKETHCGSHSPYAHKLKHCGGGAMIHLGIHPIGFICWLIEQKITEVIGKTSGGGSKNLVHTRFEGEDWGVSVLTFKEGPVGFVEANYVTLGGMDARIEIYGTKGNIKIDLTHGSPIRTFSLNGYQYAIEKAETTKGWTFPAVDEEQSFGFYDEISYFVDCVRLDRKVMKGVRGEDGRTALRVVLATYQSTREGKVIKLQPER